MSSWIVVGLAVGGAVAVVGLVVVVAVVVRRRPGEAATSGAAGGGRSPRPGPPADVLGAVVVALFVGALCGLVAATVTFLVQ